MSDYESPRRSVKQALSELQLKTKLLEEERDYFVHLQQTSSVAFADHRAELENLLEKERRYAAAQEEKLRAHLQKLVTENEVIDAQHVETKRHSTSRLRTAVEEFQTECQVRERRLREEADRTSEQAQSLHYETRDKMGLLEQMRLDVEDLKQRQTMLQEEVRQLTEDNQRLTDEVDFETRQRLAISSASTRGRAASSGRGGGGASGGFGSGGLSVMPSSTLAAQQRAAARSASRGRSGGEKGAFIPSGRVDRNNIGTPATSNFNAVVQTIRRVNIRSPKRNRATNPQHSSSTHLDGICRSLIAELLELRAEYDALCRTMASPQADSLTISTRLRQVFASMDQKMAQLRGLRQSQHKLDDEQRLNDLLAEVAEENNHAATTFQDLVQVIRDTHM